MTDDDVGGRSAYLEGVGLLSSAAVEFHVFALLFSIKDGQPGFVSDDYVTARFTHAKAAVMELEVSGAWIRRPGGYFIVADEMVKTAIEFSERLEAECAKPGPAAREARPLFAP